MTRHRGRKTLSPGSRYDAARVVDAFAAHVRGSVAPETVREEFAATVQQTVQPAHVSVWIA